MSKRNTKVTKIKANHVKELKRLRDSLKDANQKLNVASKNINILISFRDKFAELHKDEFNDFIVELKEQKKKEDKAQE